MNTPRIPNSILNFDNHALVIAARAAIAGGNVITRLYGLDNQVSEKGVGDLVLNVDIDSEEAVLTSIRNDDAETCIVSEEQGPFDPETPHPHTCWIVVNYYCDKISQMIKEPKNVAYIDNTNLHKGCESEGFNIDYVKFRTYLKERLGVKTAYIFIGYVPGNEEGYKKFQERGYTLVFKPTIQDGNGNIKGNCDAELVLQATRDYFEGDFEKMIVVTSDGDFACLIQFLQERNKLDMVLSPRGISKCSTLIKKLAPKLTFLPEVKELIKRDC